MSGDNKMQYAGNELNNCNSVSHVTPAELLATVKLFNLTKTASSMSTVHWNARVNKALNCYLIARL